MKDFEITLADLHFHARHGVLRQENKVGNEFVVSITIRIPFSDGIINDDISCTISYADIYEIVKNEMSRPRKLLETVATSIQKGLTDKWPHIKNGEITICKLTPPIPNITGNARVKLFF